MRCGFSPQVRQLRGAGWRVRTQARPTLKPLPAPRRRLCCGSIRPRQSRARRYPARGHRPAVPLPHHSDPSTGARSYSPCHKCVFLDLSAFLGSCEFPGHIPESSPWPRTPFLSPPYSPASLQRLPFLTSSSQTPTLFLLIPASVSPLAAMPPPKAVPLSPDQFLPTPA